MTKQVEVITSVQRRRRWLRAEKERIVAAAMEPGAVASDVARAAGIHVSQLFRWRRGSLLKVLWHDGQGMCLYAKRLERGRFIWPSAADGAVTITPAQLGYLLEGIDWRMPQQTWRPTAAG